MDVTTLETSESLQPHSVHTHSNQAKVPSLFRLMAVRRDWKELSPVQKISNIALAAGELVLVGLALRDLQHRPADQLNGSKRVWFMTSLIQPFGPLIYFIFGRKRHQVPAGVEQLHAA